MLTVYKQQVKVPDAAPNVTEPIGKTIRKSLIQPSVNENSGFCVKQTSVCLSTFDDKGFLPTIALLKMIKENT